MSAEESARAHPPTWKIWANPIVRRYARSRLRPRGLGVWLLIVLVIAFYIYFMASSGFYRDHLDSRIRGRLPIYPLLIFQGFILFILGTGQMAAAMTAEADEGVLEYQRLAPMTPLAKVLGYLFGIPIREYVLFLSTMPVMLFCFLVGQVPIWIALQLYLIFLVAGILYHLTGLVAGTVVKNRRWAFLISMGLVFLLYTVIPQMERLGLVYFKYITILPAVSEWTPHLAVSIQSAVAETVGNFQEPKTFFNLKLPEVVFTLVTQAVLILVLVVMLWRNWHRAESHLLGKVGATGLFAWIQVMLLGNSLPLIEPGDVFPSSRLRLFIETTGGEVWRPRGEETLTMAGAYGVVTLLFLCVMILLITPDRNRQIRGWRRARKRGRESLEMGSDSATSFPWVAAMVVIGVAGWFLFTKAVVESTWFGGTEMPWPALAAYALALTTGAFGFHAILELRGRRAMGLAVILLAIVPVLFGTVLANTNLGLVPVATWLTGISPAAGPVYAVGTSLPIADLTIDLERALPRAFWFWQAVLLLGVGNLVIKLRRSRVAIAKETALSLDEPSALPE